MDLNIDNYTLQDLLNLFKLDYDFTTEDLKQAKKIVIKTHPDKSNLDKEYFLFFIKAFKIVNSIHQFRTRSSSTVYTTDQFKDEENEKLIKLIAKSPNFSKAFNEFFDNTYVRTEDITNGYGDWLRSDEDIETTSISNVAQLSETIEVKKNEMRAIIGKKDIKELGETSSHYNLAGDAPEDYGSDIFSSLRYEDLRKAHVESVVPVSKKDYEERMRFSSVNDLKKYRDTDKTTYTPISLSQSNEYLQNRQKTENKNTVMRAYELVKQDEQAHTAKLKWMMQFNILTER
jgi:hypothetical protein